MNAFARLAQRPADIPAKVFDPDDEIPEPPIPPDLDLSAWPMMMIRVVESLRSRLLVTSKISAYGALSALILAAFHEKPAGSLPNDDEWLAGMVGLGGANYPVWQSIRHEVLSELVLCSNNRLYHPKVVERVLELMERTGDPRAANTRHQEQRPARPKSKGAERTRRWRERQKVEELASNDPAGDVCDAVDACDGGVTPVTVDGVTRDVTSPPKGKEKEKIKLSPQSPPAGGQGEGIDSGGGRIDAGGGSARATAKPRDRSARKIPIPDEWAPSAEDWQFARDRGIDPKKIRREAAQFLDYWRSMGDKRADWSATWRKRVRDLTQDFDETGAVASTGGDPATGPSPDARPPGPGTDDPQWQAIAEAFRNQDRRGEADYRSWLHPLGFQGIEDGTLILSTDSRFAADKVRQAMGDRLRDAALAAGIPIEDVEVRVGHAPLVPIDAAQLAAAASEHSPPPARAAA